MQAARTFFNIPAAVGICSISGSRQFAGDKFFHFGSVCLDALQQLELVASPDKVVVGVLYFIIGVAVDVVGEEAYSLHVGEQRCGIRQVFDFHRGEKSFGARQVAFGECLEYLHVKLNAVNIGVVLGELVGTGAQEVAEVAEYEARHHGVEVNDAEYVAVVVKHHVVHLGVAVADSFGQLALAVEALRLCHLLGAGLQLVKNGFHLRHSAFGVGLNRVM